jgi:hypothetical protein
MKSWKARLLMLLTMLAMLLAVSVGPAMADDFRGFGDGGLILSGDGDNGDNGDFDEDDEDDDGNLEDCRIVDFIPPDRVVLECEADDLFDD